MNAPRSTIGLGGVLYGSQTQPTAPRGERRGRKPLKGLGPRQLEACRLKCAGLTYQQVAERLAVSPKTVENLLRQAKDKLGLDYPTAEEFRARLEAEGLLT